MVFNKGSTPLHLSNSKFFEMKYISYNAGCNTWITELFDSSIEWHNNEYQGNKKQCDENNLYEMDLVNRSYNDYEYLIG